MILNPDFEAHVQALVAYIPNDRTFEAKNIEGSNFRQLLRGVAGELFRAQGYLTTLELEYLPDQTTLFIPEWESFVGIPDDCFLGTGTITERRRDILVKLSSLGVQTAQDFVDLAAVFGVVVTVTAGAVPYTIIVNFPEFVGDSFPYSFPIVFGDTVQGLLKCVFDKLIPAHSKVIFT